MKKALLISILIYLLGVAYLVQPSPKYPDVSSGVRSDEPGDTWQNPDQKGFYTNEDRSSVLSDIQSQFAIKVWGYTIPTYRLNYPPEEAYTLVRDQLMSYYLEEIVYPLRESIFVNGWEPKKAPMFARVNPKDIPEISIHGVPYNAKITLKPVSSPVWARLFIWTMTFPSVWLVFGSLKKSVTANV